MRPKLVFALLIVGVILSFTMMYFLLSSMNPNPVEISYLNGIDFLEAPRTGSSLSLSTIKQDHFSLYLRSKEKPESQSDDSLPEPIPDNNPKKDQGLVIEEIEPDYAKRVDYQLLWGTYKPYLLYSITQASPSRVTFGFVYQRADGVYHNHRDIEKRNIFSEYPHHNSESFANSVINDRDNSLFISHYFEKNFWKSSYQRWSSITTSAHPPGNFLSQKPKGSSFIYYFAIESLERVSEESRKYLQFNLEKGLITIRKFTDNTFLGQFQVLLYSKQAQKPLSPSSLSSVGCILRATVATVQENESFDIKKILQHQLYEDRSLEWKVLPDNYKKQDNTTTFVALQFTFKEEIPVNIQVVYSTKQEDLIQDPNYSDITHAESSISLHFLPKLKRIFNEQKDEKIRQCQVTSVSNLLSGIAYDYGPIVIYGAHDNQPALPLFTGTPSKTKFPRGFLWDEGFHGLIYCHMNTDLCLKTLTSWMNTQLPNGWIPREQARGGEAIQYFDHREYLVQKRDEANPPTMLFHVQRLIEIQQTKGLEEKASKMLNDLNPKIFKWFEWFNVTQKVNYKGSILFQWKSDKTGQGLVLGSGLDDYPRGVENGLEPLGHLDLQIWMIFFVEQLNTLAQLANKTEEIIKFWDLKTKLEMGLEMFFDPSDNLYKDLVKNSKGDLEFSPHFGYVNLFPLFFGQIKDKKRLETLLGHIESDERLWTPYGLRSLAKDDRLYMKTRNNYWGGPIWINLNYLTLRGLKVHYFENEKAQKIYKELRANLIKTVCDNKDRTGYFWEQYNQDDGHGQENHPFNGWTALIGLIIAEKY